MPDYIHLTEFGANPDSREDAVPAFQRAIAAAAQCEGTVKLSVAKGCYHFYPEYAAKVPYYISNTASEAENPDVTKTVGILFKEMKDVTLEGNGSLFLFHSKMTTIVVDGCENIHIRNVNVDFERATMSEMEVEAIGQRHLDVRVLCDSSYEIKQGQLFWIGEGWRYEGGPAQQYDPETNVTWRVPHPILLAAKVEELEPFHLRLHYNGEVPDSKVGNVYQLRDGIRDQVGAFIVQSRNVTWEKAGMHYMHGLGIVCQYSENVSFEEMRLKPRAETGRTCAGFADFIHVSGCRGMIRVANSCFEGAHDDAINVHGTHLRIVDKPSPNQVVVRFMHGQSYGFEVFFPGDEIDFIRVQSLTAYASNIVQSTQRINKREVLLTLEQSVLDSIEHNDVVENVTWTPEVEIRGNRFARIPTRGILVTTRRKVVIEHNRFERTGMSGILIADDAESWFESGIVRDVTIRNNHFIECGDADNPVIYIAPENKEVLEDNPVHHNIRIEENIFETIDAVILSAKSTSGIVFRKNEIHIIGGGKKLNHLSDAVHLLACSEVDVSGNTMTVEVEKRCD